MPPINIYFQRLVETHLGGKKQRDLLGARLVKQWHNLSSPTIARPQRIFEEIIHSEHYAAIVEPAVAIDMQRCRPIRDERANAFRGWHNTVNIAVDVAAKIQTSGQRTAIVRRSRN